MSLRDHLQAIYDQAGVLTPGLVVDAARPEEHPLHHEFEWDDAVAGEAYRLSQARRLIRSVRVVYKEATDKEAAKTIRHYHSVREENGNVYRPADEIVRSPFLTQLLLNDMEREWKQLRRRWGGFREFVELIKRDLGGDGEAA